MKPIIHDSMPGAAGEKTARVIDSNDLRRLIFAKTISTYPDFLSCITVEYISYLGIEFSDPADRKTALSVILPTMITALKESSERFCEENEFLEERLGFLNMPVEIAENGDDEAIIFHLDQRTVEGK